MAFKKAGTTLSSLTLTFALVAGASIPVPAAATPINGLIALPECTDMQGRQISYIPRTTQAMRAERLAIGAAWNDPRTGQPYIDFDAERLPATPPEFQLFALYHECAHHQLGHTSLKANDMTKPLQAYEEDADCAAFTRLHREKGFGMREINIIGDTNARLFPSRTLRGGSIKWETPDRREILTRCLNNN